MIFLETLCFSLPVKNGLTALEIAEVKLADEEAEIMPEWSDEDYVGVKDYGILIELLRGNLVESVTPHVSNLSFILTMGSFIMSSYNKRRVKLLLTRRIMQKWEMRERSSLVDEMVMWGKTVMGCCRDQKTKKRELLSPVNQTSSTIIVSLCFIHFALTTPPKIMSAHAVTCSELQLRDINKGLATNISNC